MILFHLILLPAVSTYDFLMFIILLIRVFKTINQGWLLLMIFVFALSSAREQRIDVVLVDTAGRMQDNEPLMRALSKVS